MASRKLRATALLHMAFLAPTAVAHHSTVVHYDTERESVFENVTVREWQFINPHARLVFEAPNSRGEVVEWTAQSTNVNRLRRLGFTQDSFKAGDVVTIAGQLSRDGRPDVNMIGLVRFDGSVVNFLGPNAPQPIPPEAVQRTVASGDRDFSGVWENIEEPVPPELIEALVPEGAVFWVSPGQGPEEARGETRALDLTEKAAAFLARWTPAHDECRPTSGWMAMSSPFLHQFERAQGDRIHVRHEYLDIERTIWLDGRRHPRLDRVPKTLSGHSVGRWESDTLVVETTGMLENQLTRNGIYHSESAVLREWISRDGDQLTILRVMEDPTNFKRPIASILRKRLTAYPEVPAYGDCVLQQSDAR